MTSLLKRTLVLSFARFGTQAIALLSPIILVRILSIAEYGKYREFMLYGVIISLFATFGIRGSLLFLIPKYPEREKVWLTQTTLFLLLTSSIAAALIGLAGDYIRANTSFDFVTPLQLYVLFLTNLNFVESYWVSKKRTDNVLYYSLSYMGSRLTLFVVVAWVTRDAQSLVHALVALESVRCLLILVYAKIRRWFAANIDRENITVQFSYFLPLGAGDVLARLNHQAGMVFTATLLGAESLALYVIGSFATQITDVLRNAIADVILPEIAGTKHSAPREALPLWQRATIWYCIILFPMAMCLAYYSDEVVTTLFTAEYRQAIPVFAMFTFLMYLICFDFHTPLKVRNANRFFLWGSLLKLVLNLALIYPAYLFFGLLGPVIALLISHLLFVLYLGVKVTVLFKVSWAELVPWRDVIKVLFAAVICLPILVSGRYLLDQQVVRCIVFGAIYLAMYVITLRLLGMSEVIEMLIRIGRTVARLAQNANRKP